MSIIIAHDSLPINFQLKIWIYVFVKLKLIYIYIRTVDVFYARYFLICISLVKIDKVFYNELNTDFPSKLNLMLNNKRC